MVYNKPNKELHNQEVGFEIDTKQAEKEEMNILTCKIETFLIL